MKYVAVSCDKECEKLSNIMQVLIGRVIFVDVENKGIPGAATGYDGVYHASVSETKLSDPWIDLHVASFEKAVKTLEKRLFPEIKGLGDVVAKITGFLGIKPCGGCKKRQEALNKLIPIG